MMSEEQRLSLNKLLAGATPLETMSVEDMRAGYEQTGKIIPVAQGTRFEQLSANGVPIEIGLDAEADESFTIFYLHGGGGVVGSIDSHRGILALLGQVAHSRTVSVGFRLAPEHVFPAALDDAIAAYRWLLETGLSANRISFAGDSAGGGLVVSVLLKARDLGLPMPAGCVLFSPLTDMTASGASMDEKSAEDLMVTRAGHSLLSGFYIGGTDRKDPLVSPVFGNLRGLPPLLIHVGTSETMMDDSIALARQAMMDDVSVRLEGWPRMQHNWQLFASILDEGRESLEAAARFLVERMSQSSNTN